MAICTLNRDLLKSTSCGYSLPTITDIYLANFEDVTATAISAGTGASAGCEEVTAITMESDTKFYHIEPAKDSVTFADELTVGDSGNKYRAQSLTFTVNGTYDACMHGALDALSLGRYIAVVKTAEGSYLMLGRVTGVEAESASINGGETNGMIVTLSANTTESALPLSDAAIAVVLGD